MKIYVKGGFVSVDKKEVLKMAKIVGWSNDDIQEMESEELQSYVKVNYVTEYERYGKSIKG